MAGDIEALRREVGLARAEAAARDRQTGPASGANSPNRRYFIVGGTGVVVAAGVVAGVLATSSGGRHPRAVTATTAQSPGAPTSTTRAAPPTSTPLPPTTVVVPAPPRPPAVPPAAPVRVPVAPGQSFWSIAQQVVDARVGPTATTAQVAAYWRELIAANASRLPVPGQPDLLYPGTVLVLPRPGA